MARRNRNSLSDWWGRPEADADDTPDVSDSECDDRCDDQCDSPAKRLFSPTKRAIPEFCIGDDSDTGSVASPRKRLAAMTPDTTPAGGRSTLASPQEATINTAMMTILRGICADYFENNVSPILRYVQQTQDQIITQLKEVTDTLGEKANRRDVIQLAEVEQVAARAAASRASSDDAKVAMQVRLEQIASAMNQKAHANNVPTLAQHSLKANTKEQAELEGRVKTAEDKVANLTEELHGLKQADAWQRAKTAEDKVANLAEELHGLKKAEVPTQPADLVKLKAAFVATGRQYERQLKEMQKRMEKCEEQCLGKDVGERWPGRKLDSASVASVHSTDRLSLNSDNDSDRLSLGASALGSQSLEPEEKAELKKIRSIVSAAGNVFSRDMHDVKKQVNQMRADLLEVKKSMSTSQNGSASKTSGWFR